MRRRVRPDRRVGLLLGGVVFFAFLSLGMTVVLPAADPVLGETTDAGREFGPLERAGMEVYRSEGCWYCHTQQAREGQPFGEALEPGDYGDQDPAMLGHVRIGPDLTHVGSRYDDAGVLIALLNHPRRDGRKSVMPSYDYLSDDEVRALAAYLLALK